MTTRRLIINTIKSAAVNLAYIISVIIIMSVIIMLIYGQLFGIFDPHLTAGTWGLARIFKMLTSPPPLDPIHVTQSITGALVLYYWSTILIRLTFGSFVSTVTSDIESLRSSISVLITPKNSP